MNEFMEKKVQLRWPAPHPTRIFSRAAGESQVGPVEFARREESLPERDESRHAAQAGRPERAACN